MGREKVYENRQDNEIFRPTDILNRNILAGYYKTLLVPEGGVMGMPYTIETTSQDDKRKNKQIAKNGNKSVGKKKKKEIKQAIIPFGVYLDQGKIEGIEFKGGYNLNAFDKRVAYAVYSLVDQGIMVTTLTQIYNRMGYKSRPIPTVLNNIETSLHKLRGNTVIADTKMESEVYDYPRITIKDSIIDAKIADTHMTEYRNSVKWSELIEKYKAYLDENMEQALLDTRMPANQLVIIRDMPPIYTFAKRRGQYTTIPIKVLQTPLYKTIDNMEIEDQLLNRIVAGLYIINLKKFRDGLNISYKKLNEWVKFGNGIKIQRFELVMIQILNYWKEIHYIKDFRKGKNYKGEIIYEIAKNLSFEEIDKQKAKKIAKKEQAR